MGWGGGSLIGAQIWDVVKKYVPELKKKVVAEKIIQILEDHDADNMYEAHLLWRAAKRKVAADE